MISRSLGKLDTPGGKYWTALLFFSRAWNEGRNAALASLSSPVACKMDHVIVQTVWYRSHLWRTLDLSLLLNLRSQLAFLLLLKIWFGRPGRRDQLEGFSFLLNKPEVLFANFRWTQGRRELFQESGRARGLHRGRNGFGIGVPASGLLARRSLAHLFVRTFSAWPRDPNFFSWYRCRMPLIFPERDILRTSSSHVSEMAPLEHVDDGDAVTGIHATGGAGFASASLVRRKT